MLQDSFGFDMPSICLNACKGPETTKIFALSVIMLAIAELCQHCVEHVK